MEAFVKGFTVALGIGLIFLRKHLLAAAAAAWKFIAPLLANPITWIIAAIVALGVAIGLLIDDFMAWKEGADSALAPIWNWFSKIGDKITQLKEKWDKFWASVKSGDIVKKAIKFFANPAKGTLGAIASVNDTAKAIQSSKVNNRSTVDNSRETTVNVSKIEVKTNQTTADGIVKNALQKSALMQPYQADLQID